MTTLDRLKQLISFDTTSRNSNLSLIEYLANGLNDFKVNPILIHDSKEQKANLLATLPGKQGRLYGRGLFYLVILMLFLLTVKFGIVILSSHS
ncbi:hypothetical protein PGH45_00010 [Legionella pneumophila]|nr:hypothetical protein [Legionella pneumophila]